MYLKISLATLTLAAALTGCRSIPGDVSVADYCAADRHKNENVCRLNVEIDGTRTALANTDLRLDEARTVADLALGRSDRALNAAENAQQTANTALTRANSALLREQDLACETRTLLQTDTGTCQAGYSLLSCTQTRYTTRSGGLSFLREINNEKCRFNSRVLEMQVRCCTTHGAPATDLAGGF